MPSIEENYESHTGLNIFQKQNLYIGNYWPLNAQMGAQVWGPDNQWPIHNWKIPIAQLHSLSKIGLSPYLFCILAVLIKTIMRWKETQNCSLLLTLRFINDSPKLKRIMLLLQKIVEFEVVVIEIMWIIFFSLLLLLFSLCSIFLPIIIFKHALILSIAAVMNTEYLT